MEVLHDVRPQRSGAILSRAIAGRAAIALIIAMMSATACRGRDEAKIPTADSVVSQSGGRPDTGNVYTVRPKSDSLPPDVATAPAPTWDEPSTVLVADSVTGQRVYRRVAGCIACHGQFGEGVSGLGSPLNDADWKHGDGALSFLFRVIRDGITESGTARVIMPASRQIPDREIFQMAAYVYSISRTGRSITDSTALPPGAPPIAKPPGG